MAESSARSSRLFASSGQGGAGYGGLGSPIAYRVAPLGHSDPMPCDCGEKACRWISWSDNNSGRRYYKCQHAKNKEKDCGFFKWLDDECSPWYKEVLRDLRDAVWKLKKGGNSGIADEVVDGILERSQELEKMKLLLQKELLKKNAELDVKLKELEDKDQLVEALEAKINDNNWFKNKLVWLCGFLVILLLARVGNVGIA